MLTLEVHEYEQEDRLQHAETASMRIRACEFCLKPDGTNVKLSFNDMNHSQNSPFNNKHEDWT